MNLLWLTLMMMFIASGFTLARAYSLRRWTLKSPVEEAMEFASFSAGPHPIYPNNWIIWTSFCLILTSVPMILLDVKIAYIIAMFLGGVAFFAYDLSGSKIRTSVTVLPEGIYFEAVSGEKRPFLIAAADIARIVKTRSGLFIQIKPLKFGNRLPIRCKKAEKLIEIAVEMLGIKSE